MRSSRLQLSHDRPLEGRQTLWLPIFFCPNHAAAVPESSEGLETVTFKSCHLVAWVGLSGTAATSLAEGPSAAATLSLNPEDRRLSHVTPLGQGWQSRDLRHQHKGLVKLKE